MTLKINKCPDTKKHQGLKENYKDGTYLSWWIANLGVDPLLLFAAFLFLPALVFLRALLFFVTFVFDTILLLLQRKPLSELRRIKYLPRLISSVKAFALLLLPPIFLASAGNVKPLKNQSLILSIGEVREISAPNLDRFTLGNGDSVSHKFIQKKGLFLIKAKKLGVSELHIWERSGGRKKYQIYVLSRVNQLKLVSIAESLRSLGLIIEHKGPFLEVSGELQKPEHYKAFLRTEELNKEKLQIKLSLSKHLKKELLGEVLKTLFDDHISGFKCEFKNLKLICHLSDGRTPSPEIEKYLKNHLGVKFIRHLEKNKKKNYRLKLKIIQVESSDSGAHGFGLHQLSGDLKSLFEQGWQSLYEKNKIILKDLGVNAGLLAEPVVLIRPDRKVKIQVGAEIPYTSTNAEGNQNTIFKFAGLKLNILLKKEGDGFLIDYSAEITKPGQAGEIGGSKESASARITLIEPLELFEINFQTNALSNESLPALGRIPLIGKLFSNGSNSKSYKKITGLILLEEK